MFKKIKFLLLLCGLAPSAYGQPHFLHKLAEGRPQHIVVYGTSLSSGGNGRNWMEPVVARLRQTYGDSLVTYTLAGKGGKWSTWGVQHVEDSVIRKKPDVVLLEFGMNDAFLDYHTSVEVAKLNLVYLVERIRLSNPECEIILQVMNMAIGKSASYRPNLNAYYTMYREVAKELDIGLIDHYPNWQTLLDKGEAAFREYVPDGLHPNKKGATEIIAPQILSAWGI